MDEQANVGSMRHSGMFKPGVSGNPSGRPKSDATIRDLARQHTESAIQILIEVAENKKAPQSARVHAACALLDRGWGKPSQYVESMNVGATLQDFLQELARQEALTTSVVPPLDNFDVH